MNLTANRLGARLRQMGRQGIAAVEFALTLPVWITLLLGAGDGTYYLLVHEKMDRISYTLTDIITQYQTITLADLGDIMLATEQLMKPFSFSEGQGEIIVSSVYKPSTGVPVVKWQYKYPTTGTQSSTVGSTGSTAVLPNGLTLNANDNVIISEVYYHFTPMFAGDFLAKIIYRVAVFKPRLSPLVTPPT